MLRQFAISLIKFLLFSFVGGSVAFALFTQGWSWLPDAIVGIIVGSYASARSGKNWEALIKRTGLRQSLPWSRMGEWLFPVIAVELFGLLGMMLAYWAVPLLLTCLGVPNFPVAAGNDDLINNLIFRSPPEAPGFWGWLRYLSAYFGWSWFLDMGREAWITADWPSVFRRGRRERTGRLVRRLLQRFNFASSEALEIPWGDIKLPASAARFHWAVVGATASGKSTLIRRVMYWFIQQIRPQADRRALIFSYMNDHLSQLHGMRPNCRIYTMHPLDQRSVMWDVARDCQSLAAAQQIASILIPTDQNQGPNQFFSDASRELLQTFLEILIKTAPKKWTLRDVLVGLQDPVLLRTIFEAHPEAHKTLHFWSEQKTFQSVFATLRSHMGKFEALVASWSHATESLSLTEWIKSDSILVLGHDPRMDYAISAINKVLFTRIAELLLSQPPSNQIKTFLFLDEARELGRLGNLLRSLLTAGRGKGTSVLLGFQDIEGLQAAFGDKEARESVGQCANKAILRLESEATARWASHVVGSYEVLDFQDVNGNQNKRQPKQVSEQLNRRDVMLPSEFMELPAMSRTNGLTGVFLSPFTGMFRAYLSWREAVESTPPPSAKIRDYIPRPIQHQKLEPWNDADLQRLGLFTTNSTAPITTNPTAQKTRFIGPVKP